MTIIPEEAMPFGVIRPELPLDKDPSDPLGLAFTGPAAGIFPAYAIEELP